MGIAFAEIAFTKGVRGLQSKAGSREMYAAMDHSPSRKNRLTEREAVFIESRDHFFQASVSETGWPYVQHRGGPSGFLKVLDDQTLGFADFRGNVQYISVGNLLHDDRISLILMDYANQRRLKILGRVRFVEHDVDPGLIAQLSVPEYNAEIERGFIIKVEAYDWNCPQHITPRFTLNEIAEMTPPGRNRDNKPAEPASNALIGKGSRRARISAVQELGKHIREYTLTAVDGRGFEFAQGDHIEAPFLSSTGELEYRHYSITRQPSFDVLKVAVKRIEKGQGGSKAIFEQWTVGVELSLEVKNHGFHLPTTSHSPKVLIAGGIGITPFAGMATAIATRNDVAVHWAYRHRAEAPYLDELQAQLPSALHVYDGSLKQRMNIAEVLAAAPPDIEVLACGPASMIAELRQLWASQHRDPALLHIEQFAVDQSSNRAFTVLLDGHADAVVVDANQSMLDALNQSGLNIPFSCKAGNCRSCVVRVLEGLIDHRDACLTEEEHTQGLMCTCVSRAHFDQIRITL